MSKNRILSIATIIILIPLIEFAYLGFFIRYLADDYCMAPMAREMGIWGLVTNQYAIWTGKFTYLILEGIIGNSSIGLVSVLPMLLLIFWTVIATWTLYQIALTLQVKSPLLISVLFATLALYAIFVGAPNIVQSLFWVGGILPYTGPLAFLNLIVGIIIYSVRRMKNRPAISPVIFVVVALLTFVIGGSSESYVLFQSAVLVLMLIGVRFIVPERLRRGAISLISVGLLFSILALVVILMAPGNAVRQANFEDTLPLSEVIIRTLRVSASFFATDIAVFSPVPLLVALFLPAIVVSQFTEFERPIFMTPRRTRSLMLLSLGIGLLLVLVVVGPPIFATSVAPAPRVYLAAHLVMICVAGFWGCVIGVGLNRRGISANIRPSLSVTIVLAIVLVLGPGLTTLQTINNAPLFRTFADEWDKRDTYLHQVANEAGQDIEVTPFNVDLAKFAALDTIEQDTSGWVNVCAAAYYGAKTIAAAPT